MPPILTSRWTPPWNLAFGSTLANWRSVSWRLASSGSACVTRAVSTFLGGGGGDGGIGGSSGGSGGGGGALGGPGGNGGTDGLGGGGDCGGRGRPGGAGDVGGKGGGSGGIEHSGAVKFGAKRFAPLSSTMQRDAERFSSQLGSQGCPICPL